MPKRPYASAVRDAAANEKRERVVQAAACLLRDAPIAANFSLETVAKKAGVTRLTVYNQFGSRKGLLEAVFDEIALRGRLARLPSAITIPDARDGLNYVIEIFCEFWSSDPAIERLHDSMALDAEFAQALTERNEWRRELVKVLVDRVAGGAASTSDRRDAVDLIFALTSFPMFRLLSRKRSFKGICRLIQAAVADALSAHVGAATRSRMP